MTRCSVALPYHLLEFALPAEVAAQMHPGKINSSFDPVKGFERGFQILTSKLYDFNGPFWVGARGSLKFYVYAIERPQEFLGDITTVDGLEKYIDLRIPSARKRGVLSRVTLNGAPAVSRRFGDYIEVLSFPIDQQMYLDFGLRVEGIPGGKSTNTSWKKEAVAMRDAIRASIVFRPKSLSSPSDAPRTA